MFWGIIYNTQSAILGTLFAMCLLLASQCMSESGNIDLGVVWHVYVTSLPQGHVYVDWNLGHLSLKHWHLRVRSHKVSQPWDQVVKFHITLCCQAACQVSGCLWKFTPIFHSLETPQNLQVGYLYHLVTQGCPGGWFCRTMLPDENWWLPLLRKFSYMSALFTVQIQVLVR